MPSKQSDFMQDQIVFDTWITVDTRNGSQTIPSDLVKFEDQIQDALSQYDDHIRLEDLKEIYGEDRASELWEDLYNSLKLYLECFQVEDMYDLQVAEGYCCRLSAPGYSNCTEWSVFDSEKEAQDYLDEMYDDDEEDSEEEEE